MSSNRTFAMLKPDSVQAGNLGAIIQMIEASGFKVRAIKMLKISVDLAKKFYQVHKDRPFYGELVDYISSGPVVAMVLEKENAVADFRKLIGATDPAEAEAGTIRAKFGKSKGQNAIHGSDSDENAATEISFFFSDLEIVQD